MKVHTPEQRLDVRFQYQETPTLYPLPSGHYPFTRVTQCAILTRRSDALCPPEPTVVGQGTAVCAPTDLYDKQLGRRLALRRAMDAGGLGRQTRTEIWRTYFETHNDLRK